MINAELNFAIDLPYSFSIYRVNSIEKCTELIGFTGRVKRMIILPCETVRNSTEFKCAVDVPLHANSKLIEYTTVYFQYTKP